MTARIFKVENTLRKSISFSRGISIAEAVRAAEDNVIDLPPITIADVDLLIETIAHDVDGARPSTRPTVRLLYGHVNELIGMAKACGLDELGEAAFEVCDQLEQLKSDEAIAQADLKALVGRISRLREGGDDLAAAKEAELSRLRELRESGVLSTPVETLFERISQMAKDLSGAEFAMVSIVAESKQFIKAKIGLDVSETPRDVAFCNHTIQGRDVLWIEDASRDDRFRDNPLVVSGQKIRFYAGAPITLQSGHRMGAVCVLGQAPRQMDKAVSARLGDLAGMVAYDIDRRIAEVRADKAEREGGESAETLAAYIQKAAAEIVMTDATMSILHVSRRWCDTHGRVPADVIGRSIFELDAAVGDRWRAVYQLALGGEKQEGDTAAWPLGEGRTVHWQAAPWRAGGKVAGLLLMSLPQARAV